MTHPLQHRAPTLVAILVSILLLAACASRPSRVWVRHASGEDPRYEVRADPAGPPLEADYAGYRQSGLDAWPARVYPLPVRGPGAEDMPPTVDQLARGYDHTGATRSFENATWRLYIDARVRTSSLTDDERTLVGRWVHLDPERFDRATAMAVPAGGHAHTIELELHDDRRATTDAGHAGWWFAEGDVVQFEWRMEHPRWGPMGRTQCFQISHRRDALIEDDYRTRVAVRLDDDERR